MSLIDVEWRGSRVVSSPLQSILHKDFVGDSVIFDIIFPREYLRAALVVSLLSIWVLVVLFYYLNRYTKRMYFTIWTAAWLFYALWLTLGLSAPNPDPASLEMIIRQSCVGVSAVFLLWGSLSFL